MPLHVLGERYADIDGIHTRYLVAGEVPMAPSTPLLLLHGIPGGVLDWLPLRDYLVNLGQVHALDLPGFGLTAAPPGFDPTSRELARFSLAFLDAMGVTDPVLAVGHSNGGAIAQAMAIMAPSRIRGLVLIASIGFPAPAPGASLLGSRAVRRLITGAHEHAPRPWVRAVLRQVLQRNYRRPGNFGSKQLDRAVASLQRPGALDWILRVTAAIDPEYHETIAPLIRTPTLIVHGEYDRIVPVRIAENLHQAIVGSRLVIVGRGSHLIHIEEADEIARLVTDFSRAGADSPVGAERSA